MNRPTGMMKAKRSRAPNWEHSERTLLKAVIKDHEDAIECKLTDTNTNAAKRKAWEHVHKIFTELNERRRTLPELRQQWRTLKLESKKSGLVAEDDTMYLSSSPDTVQISELLSLDYGDHNYEKNGEELNVPVKPEILSLDFGENDCDDEDSNIPIKIEHVQTGDLSIQGPTSDADSSFSELEDSSRATSSSNATQKKKRKPLKEDDRDYYKKVLQKTAEETSEDAFEMRKKEHKWLQKEHEEKMRILREERQINKLRLEILKLKKESLLNR